MQTYGLCSALQLEVVPPEDFRLSDAYFESQWRVAGGARVLGLLVEKVFVPDSCGLGSKTQYTVRDSSAHAVNLFAETFC